MVKKFKKELKLINTKYKYLDLLYEYKRSGLSVKTINTINLVYQDYLDYFFSKPCLPKIYHLCKDSNIFPKKFFELSNITKYIDSLKTNAPSTKIKKRNILKKVLFEISNGTIKKKKYNKDKEKIQRVYDMIALNDLADFMSKIFQKKDINQILVFQLSFELGLSLSQIIKLKFKHIKNDYSHILFKENKKQIYRALSLYSGSLLKFHWLDNNKEKDDYIVFDEIKNLKKSRREKTCIDNIKKIIVNDININQTLKNKIFNLLKKQRPRFKLNSISLEEKNKFFRNIFDNLYYCKNNKNSENRDKNDFINEKNIEKNLSEIEKNSGLESLVEIGDNEKEEINFNANNFDINFFENNNLLESLSILNFEQN